MVSRTLKCLPARAAQFGMPCDPCPNLTVDGWQSSGKARPLRTGGAPGEGKGAGYVAARASNGTLQCRQTQGCLPRLENACGHMPSPTERVHAVPRALCLATSRSGVVQQHHKVKPALSSRNATRTQGRSPRAQSRRASMHVHTFTRTYRAGTALAPGCGRKACRMGSSTSLCPRHRTRHTCRHRCGPVCPRG